MTIGTNEPIPENHFSGGANLTGDQPGNLAPMLEAMRLDVARSGETTEDMDIWVSPLGDDTTGEGTESEPYRTPTRAFRDIPFQINHSVHVRFAGGTYTDFPSLVYHRCGKNGALFLEGLGLPTPSAGPFTVSSYSLGVNFAYTEIQVLGAGWSVDQFYNKWVRVTAGTAAGLIFPIFKNSADTIVIPATFPSAGTVTEIEILDDPTVTMDVGTGKVVFDTGFAGNGPSLSIGGIKFKSALDGFPFRVQASKIFCAFTKFETLDPSFTNASAFDLVDSEVGLTPPGDPLVFDNLNFSTPWGGAVIVSRGNTPWTGGNSRGMYMKNSRVSRIVDRFHLFPRESGFNFFQLSALGAVFFSDLANGRLFYCLVDHASANFANPPVGFDAGCNGWLWNIYIGNANNTNGNAIVTGTSDLVLINVDGDTPNISGYAIEVGPGTIVWMSGGVNLAGGTGDIIFTFGSGAASWPGSGLSVNDGAGSHVYNP